MLKWLNRAELTGLGAAILLAMIILVIALLNGG